MVKRCMTCGQSLEPEDIKPLPQAFIHPATEMRENILGVVREREAGITHDIKEYYRRGGHDRQAEDAIERRREVMRLATEIEGINE